MRISTNSEPKELLLSAETAPTNRESTADFFEKDISALQQKIKKTIDHTPSLPPQLMGYVTAEQLEKNAQNYPEMSINLTDIQKERVEKIKKVMEDIPLIHATSSKKVISGVCNISPLDDLDIDHDHHSDVLDQSLGLTSCVFFHWGMAQKGYGSTVLQFSPKLLDQNNVFVTPVDIGHIVMADEGAFEELTTIKKHRIQEQYFNRIVTGKIWKEIIARRVLIAVESGTELFSLSSNYSLGEVKYFGSVSSKEIISSFSVNDMREHYRDLYEHGFAFENMERDREGALNTGKRAWSANPSHEECGIDYEKVRMFWKSTLGL